MAPVDVLPEAPVRPPVTAVAIPRSVPLPVAARKEEIIDGRRMLKVLAALALAMGAATVICFAMEPAPPVSRSNTMFPAGMAPLRPWRYVVIHHTATEAGSVDAIDAAHRRRGWDGIGYHFVIGNGRPMADGRIVPTERWLKQRPGAHCRVERPRETLGDFGGTESYNEYGIGIALVGDFSAQPPTPAQLDSLVETLYVVTTRLGISTDHVLGHGELEATACPGAKFPMRELIRRLGEKYRRAASN